MILLASVAAQDESKAKTEIRQEISIKDGAPVRPPVSVPAPRADKEIVDEVVRSLDVYKGEAKPDAEMTVPLSSRRLALPFPEPPFLVFSPQAVAAPYDSWVFEVLSGGEVIWRTDGDGRLREPIEWDGSGGESEAAARVEKPFRFRFTGRSGSARFTITSQPVTLRSLSYREYLGETHLEVANSELFAEGQPAFSPASPGYLKALEDRLRLVPTNGKPYRFIFYSAEPKGALARERAARLRAYFAKRLLINPRKVEVDVVTAASRGEITTCILPADKGAALKND